MADWIVRAFQLQEPEPEFLTVVLCDWLARQPNDLSHFVAQTVRGFMNFIHADESSPTRVNNAIIDKGLHLLSHLDSLHDASLLTEMS